LIKRRCCVYVVVSPCADWVSAADVQALAGWVRLGASIIFIEVTTVAMHVWAPLFRKAS